MYNKISAILIWSEDYKKLVEWYKEKFGFETIEELNHPDDTGVGLRVGESYLWIGKHSKVSGKIKTHTGLCLTLQLILSKRPTMS